MACARFHWLFALITNECIQIYKRVFLACVLAVMEWEGYIELGHSGEWNALWDYSSSFRCLRIVNDLSTWNAGSNSSVNAHLLDIRDFLPLECIRDSSNTLSYNAAQTCAMKRGKKNETPRTSQGLLARFLYQWRACTYFHLTRLYSEERKLVGTFSSITIGWFGRWRILFLAVW